MGEAAARGATVGHRGEHGADEEHEPVGVAVVFPDGLAGQLGQVAADLADLGLVRDPEAVAALDHRLDRVGAERRVRTGTRLDQYDFTDTVMLCQGERGILEFRLESPGQYMFHAHQSELAELGWVGMFEATE